VLSECEIDRSLRRFAQLLPDESVEALRVGCHPLGGFALVPGFVVRWIAYCDHTYSVGPGNLRDLSNRGPCSVMV
jgi:hypothetical protein